MDNAAANKLVEQTFMQPFVEDKFKTLSRNLFTDLIEKDGRAVSGKYIREAYSNHISSYKRIAKYVDPNDRELDILIVKLKNLSNIKNARTLQRNFIADYLKQRNDKDAAIVAFYSEDSDDWRFSYVKMEYRTDFSEEKPKIKTELTPAKRYSFLVGKNEPNHTARSQISPLLEREEKYSIEELENSFNIESITKEFFNKYKDLYLKLKEELDTILSRDSKIKEDFETHDIQTEHFTKKLLGQIVFLYFLQKKGWLGVEKDLHGSLKPWGTGHKNFMSKLFSKEIVPYKNFFNDVLEPLFYEALATEHENGYYSRFKCRIPFLNGGLFEPINGYNWQETDIRIDNDIFKTILETFDLYNFTVKEDEPLEKEVAIDPEMLGKVFENLLEVKDRKSKGAFYTPREIVHYMCQESLINYLDVKLNTEKRSINEGKTVQGSLFGNESDGELTEDVYIEKVPKKDIEEFVRHGDFYIDYALRNKTKRENGLEIKGVYKERELPRSIIQKADLVDSLLHEVKICDPAIGSGAFPVGLMNEIVRARYALSAYGTSNPDRTIYNFKRQCIKDCIYGVDIDSAAIDIAKLRLWLSLIVDEDDFENIQPLPNLDYKIVCGNSLIGADNSLEDNLFIHNELKEIEEYKKHLFDTTSSKKKNEIRFKINSIIKKITGVKEIFDFNIHFSEVFHKNNGFDIVIGNPPYGLLNKKQNKAETIVVTAEELEYFKKSPIYEHAIGGMINIFRLFIAKSIDILKPSGSFLEIFPLAFIGDSSISKLRKFILDNHNLLSIDTFSERDNPNKRVFAHAKMSVCIMNLIKNQIYKKQFFIRTHSDKYIDTNNSKTFLNPDIIKLFDNKRYTIPIINQNGINLLEKIYLSSYKIEKIGHCFTGEVDMTLGKEFISTDSNKPLLLRGAGIDRYVIKEKMSQGEIIYLEENKFLANVSKERKEHLKKSRIVLQGITGVNENYRLKMTIAPRGIYCANSVNYLAFDKNNNKLLLGVLNSALLNFVFSKFSTNSNVNGYEVDNLPISKDIDSFVSKEKLINLVDIILAKKEKDEDTTTEELQIDQMVYNLYNLTPEEIAIVEGH